MELLLEAGTEDLPSSLLKTLPGETAGNFTRLLADQRLSAAEITVFVTVRRIVLHARGLSEKQADETSEVNGPPVGVAFGPDGAPTPAGLGYCRAHDIEPDRLLRKKTGPREIVYYLRQSPGAPAREVLPEIIGRLLGGITCPLPMRWGGNDTPFIRPLTHLLCLLNDRHLPVEFAGVRSGKVSRGHPTMSARPFAVDSIPDYFLKIKRHHVLLDPLDRRRKLTAAVAKIIPRGTDCDPAGVEDTALALEYPCCRLSRLNLVAADFPPETVATVVKKLRCLPLYGPGGRIRPEFLVVTEGRVTGEIESGFRWVLENRLEDARFFWHEDTRLSTAGHIARQADIIFQAGAGTMSEYREALVRLAGHLAEACGLAGGETEALCEAARTAKLDIGTSLVREFPELSGIAAARLLAREGVSAGVAALVREHARPRFPGDRLPAGRAAKLLAFADKTVNLAGLFLAGAEPSGSFDPYGLRRLAQGALELAWQGDLRLSLAETTAAAFRAWERDAGEAGPRMAAFLRQRAENLLAGRGFRPDIVAAALDAAGDSLSAGPKRAAAWRDLLAADAGPAETITLSRVTNIVAQARGKNLAFDRFDAGLLQEKAEKSLRRAWEKEQPVLDRRLAREDFSGALRCFTRLNPAVNRFFDEILVMSPDEKLRGNRLALLAEIAAQLLEIGDIRRLQVKR